MKQHLVLGAVGALVLVPVVAPAQAAAPAPKAAESRAVRMKTTLGWMVSYKGGKLRVAVGRKNIDYVVTRSTDCASARGNHGTTIRCSTLGQKRYYAQRVRIGWHPDVKKRRVAAFVAVILPKK